MLSRRVFESFPDPETGIRIRPVLQLIERWLKYGGLRNNYSMLNEILELANIAWLVVSHHRIHCFWRNFFHNLIQAGSILGYEMLHQ